MSGTLTLGQLTNGKPSTLKLHWKKLIHHGHFLPKGQGRGAHYVRKV